MKHFSIYKISTGEIVRTVYCPDSSVRDQYDPVIYSHIEGNYPDDEYYISSGLAVRRPSPPSKFHLFDFSKKLWVLDSDSSWAAVRAERNRRITASDWVMLPDVQMSDERRAAWTSYRQALRDVTSQPDPLNIAWPVAPT